MFGIRSKKIDEKTVLNTLKKVIDPVLKQDIVTSQAIQNLKIEQNNIACSVMSSSSNPSVKSKLKQAIFNALKEIPGVEMINIQVETPAEKPTAQSNPIQIKHMIAVASGKGGVGKSTVAVNLSLALAKQGLKVGILDADIYGPSLGKMLNLTGRPTMASEKIINPIETHGLKAMSMSVLQDPEKPVVLRGPMITGILQQFLGQVAWGLLDYLILDLPPGTGDIQLTLCQQAQLDGAIIVSTPQDVATSTTLKGLRMFQSMKVPILGMVENMSYFIAPDTGKEYNLFGKGRVEQVARQNQIPFLGSIPIEPELVEFSDLGKSLISENPQSLAAQSFEQITQTLIQTLDQKASQHISGWEEYHLHWKDL